MAVYGFKENYCKEEVVSKVDVEKKYQVKKVYNTINMSNGTNKIILENNHEYRIANISGVNNCNINIITPDMVSTGQIFESVVNIYTGSISPTASINTNGNNMIIPIGNPLTTILKANMVYQIKIWFDGFNMCYSWSVHGYVS